MHISRRRVAVFGSMLLAAAALPLIATSTPAAAASCTPAQPSVVGADATSAVVKFFECSAAHVVTGYRVFAFEDGSTDVAATADVGRGIGHVEVTGLHAGSVYRFRIASTNGGVAGSRSSLSTAAPVPFKNVASFAAQAYGDFTGAPVTDAQKADWAATVGANPPTRKPVDAVDALQKGAYWQVQSPVIRLFQAYFDRLPDQNGLNYWTGKSRRGMRINTISANFAGSSEFQRRYGKLSNRAFVNLVYENVLGRPGDPGGVSSWTSKLDRRVKDRGEVMVGFSESGEYQRKTAGQVDVVNVFTGMLVRVPNAAERDEWIPRPRSELIEFLLGSEEYEYRVQWFAPPVVTTTTVPNGVVGKPYGPVQLTSLFGSDPITWSVRFAPLPPGLVLSSGGVVSGTPTTKGFTTAGFRARSADGQYDDFGLDFSISELDITTSAVLPQGTVQVPYSLTFELTGVSGWVSLSSSDPQPIGLRVEGNAITGTPTQAGTWSFMVEAQDQAGHFGSKRFTLTIAQPLHPLIYTPTLPAAPQGSGYRALVVATGAAAPFTWSVSAGALPPGLAIDASTGLISGSATTPGTFAFTLRATDTTSDTGERPYSITVAAATEWRQPGRDGSHAAVSPVEGILTPGAIWSVWGEWTQGVWSKANVVSGGVVYSVGARQEDLATRVLQATDIDTGARLWRLDLDPAACDASSLATTDTLAIVGCGTSVRAYSLTGVHALVWDTAGAGGAPEATSVVISGSSVLAWGPAGVSALDLADGSQRWHRAAAPSTTAVDVIALGDRALVAWSDRLEGIALGAGTSSWNRPDVVTPKIVAADGWVYTSDDGGISRFAVADGTPGWKVRTQSGVQAVLAVDGDHVYVNDIVWETNRIDKLRALNVSDGSVAWFSEVAYWASSVAVVGDVIWLVDTSRGDYGGNGSYLAAYRRTDGELLRRFDWIYGRNEIPIAVAQGRVLTSVGGNLRAFSPY